MRILLAFLLLLLTILVAGMAGAADLAAGRSGSAMREGGEDFAGAVAIPGLPFTDSGATCDNQDDVTLPCVSGPAPDVVYRFTAPADLVLRVSLCRSSYDTALGLYGADLEALACNDDFCSLQSEINDFAIGAGESIYIVVDGYRDACGEYTLEIVEVSPCEVPCPAGALFEGEPVCHDGYQDQYNPGCKGTTGPDSWTEICPTAGNHAVMCGESGTFRYGDLSYRDSDWLRVFGDGGTMTASCVADFPLLLILIYGTDCAAIEMDYIQVGACETATLSRTIGAGVEAWLWIAPWVFEGVECGSRWVLTVDGIWCEATGTEAVTWGTVKGRFR